jgi:hypothetical protein
MLMTMEQATHYYEKYEEAKASKTPPGKGEFLGECNRTACNVAPAIFYNRVTHACYCVGCARKINESWRASQGSLRESEHKPLCELADVKSE